MKYFSEMDIEHTLQEYEFTLKAEQKIMRFVTDTFVVEMPPQETFDFIYQNLTPVYFKDYLKRYIYRHTGMTQPFSSVSDEEWKRTILESFKQNIAYIGIYLISFFVEKLFSVILYACGTVNFFMNTASDFAFEFVLVVNSNGIICPILF